MREIKMTSNHNLQLTPADCDEMFIEMVTQSVLLLISPPLDPFPSTASASSSCLSH